MEHFLQEKENMELNFQN